MPDGELLIRWQIDSSLRREEAVDLALRAELGGEGAGEDFLSGKWIWDLTGCLVAGHLW